MKSCVASVEITFIRSVETPSAAPVEMAFVMTDLIMHGLKGRQLKGADAFFDDELIDANVHGFP